MLEEVIKRRAVFRLTLAFFDNLVGQAMPDVMIEFFGGNIKSVVVHVYRQVFRESFEFLDQLLFELTLVLLRQDEAADVPDFIGEILVTLDLVFAERKVCARRITDDKSHAQSVRSVFIGKRKGIDNVAFGLTHLLALGVVDHTV